MTSGRHVFARSYTPLREIQRWKCKRCGMVRRRVVPVSSEKFGSLPSFWIYRVAGSVVWGTQRGLCSGMRA